MPADATRPAAANLRTRVRSILSELERRGSERVRVQMREQFAIAAPRAFGVPMSGIRAIAKQHGRDHALALALWDTGWYEARTLSAFVDEPALVTRRQMDAWARDFDNWAICDSLCFHLFDRTPHALPCSEAWARAKGEFHKRAAFALLASVALHDKRADDAVFTRSLRRIERGASDERNFVKKGVSWALRGIGHRNVALHARAVALARKFAASQAAAPRWIGRDVLRDLSRPQVRAKLAKKANRNRD